MKKGDTVALVSGRYIFHNPYRELVLYDKLVANGYKCILFLPSVTTFPKGYTKEFMTDEPVRPYEASLFYSTLDFIKKTAGIRHFLIGSDYKYSGMVILLRLMGKKVVSFDSAGGMDHKNNFAQISCVKSTFYKNFMKSLGRIKISQNTVRVTGSIIFEDMKLPVLSRKEFLLKYDCEDKVVVYFPKSIFTFQKKLHTWLKGDEEKIKKTHLYHVELSKGLCEKIRAMGFTPLVKLHPGLLNSPFYDQEMEFWRGLGVRVIDHLDAPSLYKHIDLGISFKSQSALDVNYFRKPFLYLEEGNSLPINLPHAAVCTLPLGPSNRWSLDDNPFVNHALPSWVGGLCTMETLEEVVAELLDKEFPQDDYQRFIDHFWFSDDGKASDRIIGYLLQS